MMQKKVNRITKMSHQFNRLQVVIYRPTSKLEFGQIQETRDGVVEGQSVLGTGIPRESGVSPFDTHTSIGTFLRSRRTRSLPCFSGPKLSFST